MASIKSHGRPYGDDGQPLKSPMGRPPKGDLTEDEFHAIIPILAKPRKARGGSLEAAAKTISIMRGAHTALTPRIAQNRMVSARWVSFQLVKRGLSGKKAIQEKVGLDPLWPHSRQNADATSHTGPRTGCEPFTNDTPLMNGQATEAADPFTPKVESERKEATA